MRTISSPKPPKLVEPACHVKSQIEPDGATSLRDVVKQYMSGVQPHDVKTCYFDYNINTGPLPNIEEMPEMPIFGSTMECLQYIDAYVNDKKEELARLQREAAEKGKSGANPPIPIPQVPPQVQPQAGQPAGTPPTPASPTNTQ